MSCPMNLFRNLITPMPEIGQSWKKPIICKKDYKSLSEGQNDKVIRQISHRLFFLFQKIFLAIPHSMWNSGLPSRGWIHPLYWQWTTREVPRSGSCYKWNSCSVKKQQKFEFPETDLLQTLFVIRKGLYSMLFFFFFFKEKR